MVPDSFVGQFIKKLIRNAVTGLILSSVVACGFQKPVTVPSDFSAEGHRPPLFAAIDENDLLSAIVQIDFMTKDGYFPAKAALAVKRPSYLRLELLAVIGAPDFFLAVTPERINVLIPSKGEFYTGRTTDAGVKKFLPWPIEFEDMIMIFTATYPSLKEQGVVAQRYPEDNLLRLEMKAPSGVSQTVWTGENHRLMKLVRKDEKGNETYTVKYIYHQDHDAFPEKIVIRMADGVTSLSVTYWDVKIEKATDLSIFDLAMPDDVKEISLD